MKSIGNLLLKCLLVGICQRHKCLWYFVNQRQTPQIKKSTLQMPYKKRQIPKKDTCLSESEKIKRLSCNVYLYPFAICGPCFVFFSPFLSVYSTDRVPTTLGTVSEPTTLNVVSEAILSGDEPDQFCCTDFASNFIL